MNKQSSIVEVLIENITTDQELLAELEQKVQEAKDEKRTIVDRLRDLQKDLSVLMKYADEKQREAIEKLGYDMASYESGMNPVATKALELLMKAKDNQMSNGDLYDGYVNSFKNKEDAYSYTEFNIKCRSLLNTQRVLRKKSKDGKSSREDILSINGRVATNTNTKSV